MTGHVGWVLLYRAAQARCPWSCSTLVQRETKQLHGVVAITLLIGVLVVVVAIVVVPAWPAAAAAITATAAQRRAVVDADCAILRRALDH
jgi:hypothetical protein